MDVETLPSTPRKTVDPASPAVPAAAPVSSLEGQLAIIQRQLAQALARLTLFRAADESPRFLERRARGGRRGG